MARAQAAGGSPEEPAAPSGTDAELDALLEEGDGEPEGSSSEPTAGPQEGGGASTAEPQEGGGEPTTEPEGEPEPAPEPGPANPYQPQEDAEQAIHLPRTLCQGRMIEDVVIRGARRVDPEDVRATMRLRRNVPCTDVEVTQDARALWDLGYFDDIVVEAELVGDEVRLTVTVTERPAIRHVEFEGNDEVNDDDIDEKVTLEEGSILSIPDVRQQITKIRDLYAEEGFFLARVNYELRPVPGDNNEVDVVFTIEEGEEVTVRRIVFVGNEGLTDAELAEFMQTRQTGFFSFLSSNDTFNHDTFDEDLVRLQAVYYDKGYLAMQVGTPNIELSADRRHITITIPITEGARYRIGRVGVTEMDENGEVVEPLGGREAIVEAVDLEQGDWFSRTAIAEGLQSITRTYRDAGYAHVDIVPETDLDPEHRIVNINISIRRGPLVYIERINIAGNTKTRDRVIRRELQILEGDLYNMTAIEQSKARVTALGYFESVNVSEEAGSAPNQMVLNFEVAEKATGTFQVGAGFSSLEQFILTAQIQQQNLFGNGQTLSLNVQASGIRQLFQLQFIEPYFLGSRWSMQVSASKNRMQNQVYNQDSTGGGLTFGHPLFDPRLRVFIGYNLQNVNISARLGGAFGRGSGGMNFTQVTPIPFYHKFQSGLTSSIQFTLTWDSRDNRLFPQHGWYSSYSLQVADKFIGSNNTFVQNSFFARFYQHLFGPFTLRINAQLGAITSRLPQGVAIYNRYYLGGINTIRGYYWRAIGPRAAVSQSLDPNAYVSPQGQPFGGNLEAYYQVEVEFPIVQSVGIKGVLFSDGGNAWNLERRLCQAPVNTVNDPATAPCIQRPLRIRTSVGFGFRWFSPLGPLRFEWGFPIHRRSWEKAYNFQFTIGNSF